VLAQMEARLDCHRALHEQLHRTTVLDLLGRDRRLRGQRQRRDTPSGLATDVQSLAAASQDAQSRTGSQQAVRQVPAGCHQVLAAV